MFGDLIHLAIAWVVPLAAGVLWLLTYQPNPSSQTAQTVFQGMVLCIMGMAASSILNLWLYLRRKRSARSTRWLAKGFIWSVAVTFLAVLWIRALFVAIHDDVTEHGAFVGWFGYALIMVAMYFASPYPWAMIPTMFVWGCVAFAIGTPIQSDSQTVVVPW